MRQRFEQQLTLHIVPIIDTPLNPKNRHCLGKIVLGLLSLFKNATYNEDIFSLLEKKLGLARLKNGRPGMDLWQLFVLGQIRLGCNLDYDALEHLVENDRCVRTLLGIEGTEFQPKSERISFSYQNLWDNVGLLDDETLHEINEVIVNFGNKEVFKKKEVAVSMLKTDSFVVKSNVHFPTDYSLLYDACRKCLDMIKRLKKGNDSDVLLGWRKAKYWGDKLKNVSRQIGQNSKKGGKNKEAKQKELVEKYLEMCLALSAKLAELLPNIPQNASNDVIKEELETYISLAAKFIDQLERRVLKGETIAHEEKLFSIFEQYTQWINKGKSNPSVELGKVLAITTNQNNLIIHHKILEKESDSQVLKTIVDEVLAKQKVESWSFDKGFFSKENKEYLAQKVTNLVMPKKGKLNKAEQQEQHKPLFIKTRHQHSAIESNINELEHRGLEKCPDRGEEHFKRYIAMGVCAFNLHKIGAKIRTQYLDKLKKNTKCKKIA